MDALCVGECGAGFMRVNEFTPCGEYCLSSRPLPLIDTRELRDYALDALRNVFYKFSAYLLTVTDRECHSNCTACSCYNICDGFWATVYKTVLPMLSDGCPVCPVLSVCGVRALWPNGWMDQDETSHAGRPRPR